MPLITSAGSGLWSAGATWVGGIVPTSTDEVTIAVGHTVTVDGTFVVGNDRRDAAVANLQGIRVIGTLRASRSVSSSLTLRGQCVVQANGVLDWGSAADPIPSGVTATLIINDAPTLAIARHTIVGQFPSVIRSQGVARTRWTTLAAGVSAGATTLSVAAAADWAVGDELVLEGATRAQNETVTLTSISGTTVGITATAQAHASGLAVGNITSNVVLRASGANFPSGISSRLGSIAGEITFRHTRIENLGTPVAGFVSGDSGARMPTVIPSGAVGTTRPIVDSCAWVWSSTANGEGFAVQAAPSDGSGSTFANNVLWATGSGLMTWIYPQVTLTEANNNLLLASPVGNANFATVAFGLGYSAGTFLNNRIVGSGNTFLMFSGGPTLIRNARIHSTSSLWSLLQTTTTVVEDSNLGTGAANLVSASSLANARITFRRCTVDALSKCFPLDGGNNNAITEWFTINGNTLDNRRYTRRVAAEAQTATRLNGTTAVQFTQRVAGAGTFSVDIPCVAGVSQRFIGSLRRNVAYGAANPPSIAFVGSGVSSSFTHSGAADTWEKFDLSVTPTGTGTITATVTINGTVAGSAFLDGLYTDPFIQSVRHYNFQFLPQAAQIVDTRNTLTEAAARALTSAATLDNVFDLLSVYAVDNQTVALPYSTAGTQINLGALNVVIDGTAGAALAIGGGTITIGSTALAPGAKFASFATSGTVSFVNGGGTSAIYTSGSGTSARLEIGGLTNAAVYVQNGAGVQQDYQASVSGTYALNVAPGASGTWRWVVKRAGYEHATGTFLPGVGGLTAVAPSLAQKLNPDGSAMYQGTASALCSIAFSGTTNAYIDIGNGAVGLQAAFDESEDALITAAGLTWLAGGKDDLSQFNSASGDFLFMTTGWRLRRASAGDVNATLNAFAQSADGVPVDGSNGSVQFLTSDSATVIASAVWGHMSRTLTGVTNANIVQVTGATITGTGTSSDPWGP